MDNNGSIRVLAISGSLRRNSSNTALIGAAARLAPEAIDVSIYGDLAELPPFNPDRDGDRAPAAVISFRTQLQACDAVLISSPEYAHGVPGVLKNALDWIVGSGELVDKPIAVINASGRATHAWTSLRDTLTVMSARVIVAASITVPLDGRALDSTGIVGDAALSAAVRTAIDALVSATPGRVAPAGARTCRQSADPQQFQATSQATQSAFDRKEMLLKRNAIIVLLVLCATAAGAWARQVKEAEDVKTIDITASLFRFEPATVTVAQGDRVRLRLRSADRTHAFSIKAFRVKALIPKAGEAVTTEFVADQAGTFDFTCAEYCGTGHAGMKGRLVVLAREK